MNTWEVWGAHVGFLGYLNAETYTLALRYARRSWPEVQSFSITRA